MALGCRQRAEEAPRKSAGCFPTCGIIQKNCARPCLPPDDDQSLNTARSPGGDDIWFHVVAVPIGSDTPEVHKEPYIPRPQSLNDCDAARFVYE